MKAQLFQIRFADGRQAERTRGTRRERLDGLRACFAEINTHCPEQYALLLRERSDNVD